METSKSNIFQLGLDEISVYGHIATNRLIFKHSSKIFEWCQCLKIILILTCDFEMQEPGNKFMVQAILKKINI